jgi:hypothetical protein
MLPSVVAVLHEHPVETTAITHTANTFKLRIIVPFLPKWIYTNLLYLNSRSAGTRRDLTPPRRIDQGKN